MASASPSPLAAAARYFFGMETPADRRRRSSPSTGLGDAQSSNPPDEPGMIEPDADPLDTDVEDADLFLGDGDLEDLYDDDGYPDDDEYAHDL